MKAFGDLYRLGTQAEASCDGEGVYALAAVQGDSRGVLLTNIGDDTQVQTDLDSGMTAYLIDDTHLLEQVEIDPAQFVLKTNQTVYFA